MSHFTGVPGVSGGGGLISNPAQLPMALSTKPVGFIVELAGKPVAVVDAAAKAATGKGLSTAQKNSLIAQLRAKQNTLAAAVRQIGGTVTSRFQTVYNGIGVRVPANEAYRLNSLPGVVGVFAMKTYKLDNIHGVPLIGAPSVWDGLNGLHGEGMKIADLDTGIDYTHADFGGPGTADAWNCAFANSTADPSTVTCGGTPVSNWFGPSAPRVKGGIDLVGDNYNASSSDPAKYTPVPDPNPLDCNGHGTHTAGTAAGSGVLANGTTYTGPYNADTIADNNWNVGPGVAPKANIYAVRVFGCSGSVDDGVLMQAMDWAVNNGMDAINMSLGAPFGSPGDPDSVAASNTAADGVIVVSASGNNGHAPFMTSSPGAGLNGIAVAAEDPTATFPGASLALSIPATSINAIDANGAAISGGPYTLSVVWNNPADHTAGVSLGCSVAADEAINGGNPLPANTYIVVKRGTCARVAKAIYGQQAGAAGVIMINNASGYPPYEGKITSNPDTGDPYTVTIPFLGVPSSQGSTLTSDDGGTVTPTGMTLANPGYLHLASFSSFGPTVGGLAKPEVSAPGVSIASAGMGTGTEAVIESGTSMATPHTSGMALLVKQAHPGWKKVQYWKDAIVNTATPDGVANYSTRGAGTGLIQAWDATHTQVVASGMPTGMASLNFGIPGIKKDMSAKAFIRLHNFGSSPATFNLGTAYDTDNGQTISFFSVVNRQNVPITQVTVPAFGNANVLVQLDVPLDGAATPTDQFYYWLFDSYLPDVAGLVTLTPATESDNNGVMLKVPYYVVPQAASAVRERVNTAPLMTASRVCAPRTSCGVSLPTRISNIGTGAGGFSDWFSWGASNPTSPVDIGSADLTNAGVMTPQEGISIFGISVSKPWTNLAQEEFDVYIDVNGDGMPDYVAFTADYGAVALGSPDGIPATFVYALATHHLYFTGYATFATYNSRVLEMPVPWDYLCISSNPCLGSDPGGYGVIRYGIVSFDRNGGSDMIGSFNEDGSFASSADPISLFYPPFTMESADGGTEYSLDPGQVINDYADIFTGTWSMWPQEGLMAFNLNNRSRNNLDEVFTQPISLP